MKDLVVVGAGGHGRELLDVVAAVNAAEPTWRVLGVVDDDPGGNLERLERLGVAWLGPVEWLEQRPGRYGLGIGTSSTRRALASRLESAGAEPVTVVHPGAHIGADCRLADGVVVYQGAVVTTDVHLGRHTHLNVGVAVQHDSVVGDFVQVSPAVAINGDCAVGDDVFLGTGAIVTRGVTIGAAARVGAGSVVLHDVAAGTTVVGAPATPTR